MIARVRAVLHAARTDAGAPFVANASRRLGALALVVMVTLAGCRAHVVIDPPPPPTTAEVTRRHYFATHRAQPIERGQLEAHTRIFQKRPTFVPNNIVLANGVTVYHVDDLAPLVAADSESGRAIAAARAASARADLVTGIGYGVAGVSGAVGVGVLALTITSSRQPGLPPTGVPVELYVVATSAVVALIGAGVVAWGASMRDDERDARSVAFKAFDKGLWQKLALEGEAP